MDAKRGGARLSDIERSLKFGDEAVEYGVGS